MVTTHLYTMGGVGKNMLDKSSKYILKNIINIMENYRENLLKIKLIKHNP